MKKKLISEAIYGILIILFLPIIAGLTSFFFGFSFLFYSLFNYRCFNEGQLKSCIYSYFISNLSSESGYEPYLVYESGCHAGISEFCRRYYIGSLIGDRKNINLLKCYDILSKLCENGLYQNCLYKERLLSKRLDLDVEKKLCNTANEYFSCGIAGTTYQSGSSGIDVDLEKAEKYLEKACYGGEAIFCYRLSLLYARGKDNKNAEKILRIASSLGTTPEISLVNKIETLIYIGKSERAKEIVKRSFSESTDRFLSFSQDSNIVEIMNGDEIKELYVSEIERRLKKNDKYIKKTLRR